MIAAGLARALAGAAALLIPAAALADTLIDNINGISVTREGTVTRFAAMVIDDQGRITQTFRRGERPPSGVDFRQDGRGRTVLPGFVDAHLHVSGLGFAQLTLDLTGTRSLEEALARVASYSAANPDLPWIIGRGWNQELWNLGRFPTAAELDAVTGGRPAWLERVDGHAGWANSAAMTIAGVTARTAAPDGGRITRLSAGNVPAGVFVDAAMPLVAAKVPAPRPKDRDLAVYEAQKLLLARGVTAVADMGTSIADWMAFRRAGDAGRLQMRIMAYADGVDTMQTIGSTGPTQWLYDDRLRLNGIKLFLDGALGSRGAALKEPYADEPGHKGLPLLDGTQLRNLMSRAAMDNFQVAIHAIGDAANQEALYAVEELAGDYTGDRRWRIEHAQVVDPADLARFGQFGVIASMQPVHQTSDRLMAEARLGSARLAGAYAWRSIRATGAPLAFGSDAPVEAPDPLVAIATAMSREDSDGQPFGGWQPQETIPFEQALAAHTAGAAYAGFGDGRFGRLVVGERADFVVLDRDPTTLDTTEIRKVRVLETWIAGRRVWAADGSAEEPEAPPALRGERAADAPGR
jgi:predicted amidohydrolase YtcJ